jgi:hypothetical protein
MSSKEAMPEDVRTVEDENGEGRVPAKGPTGIELAFLLKVDMVQPDVSRVSCLVSHERVRVSDLIKFK